MRAKNLKQLHKFVCERDGYICQICFKDFNFPCYFNENGVNQYVTAHHIRGQKAHPEDKLNPDVCTCVDFKCHVKIHNGEVNITKHT